MYIDGGNVGASVSILYYAQSQQTEHSSHIISI